MYLDREDEFSIAINHGFTLLHVPYLVMWRCMNIGKTELFKRIMLTWLS